MTIRHQAALYLLQNWGSTPLNRGTIWINAFLISFKFGRLHIFCRFLFGKVFKVTLHGENCRCFYRQFSVVVLGTSLVSVTYSAFEAKPSRPPGCLMINCLCWGGRDFESLAEDCSWAYWFPSFRGPDLYLNG